MAGGIKLDRLLRRDVRPNDKTEALTYAVQAFLEIAEKPKAVAEDRVTQESYERDLRDAAQDVLDVLAALPRHKIEKLENAFDIIGRGRDMVKLRRVAPTFRRKEGS